MYRLVTLLGLITEEGRQAMAQVKTVKSFRGSAKNPTLKCDACGTMITKGDSYCFWYLLIPKPDGETKRIRCMDPKCDPKPWDLDGHPRRGPIHRSREKLEIRLNEIARENFSSPRDVIDALWASVPIVAEGVSEAAEYFITPGAHVKDKVRWMERYANYERQRQTVEAEKHLRLDIRFPSYPSDGGTSEAFDPDRDGWRESCIEVVREHGRRCLDLV